MNKTLCIYHANCADGLGAAWAVHRALGDGVEFVAAKYGDLPPGFLTPGEGSAKPYVNINNPLKDRDVLIVDFSYPLKLLRAMAAEARSVLVLDHHKIAQEDLSSLPDPTRNETLPKGSSTVGIKGWLGEEQVNRGSLPSLAAIFDMNRSGAGITWDYLHPRNPSAAEPSKRYGSRPRIIDLVEDHALRRFKYGDESRAFHAVLTSYDITNLPMMFDRLDRWQEFYEYYQADFYHDDKSDWPLILEEGRATLRSRDQLVAAAVAASRRTMPIAGYVVPVANVPPQLASDAGHLLIETYKDGWHDGSTVYDQVIFAATYHDGADGKRHFSLRSPEGGADVGEIAKRMAASFNEWAKIDPSHLSPGWRQKCHGITWAGGGHKHAAGFDAPLGWEG